MLIRSKVPSSQREGQEQVAGFVWPHSWGKSLLCSIAPHHDGEHMTDASGSWENRRFFKTCGASGASAGVAV